MPTVDEGFAERDTYGNAPGWTSRQRVDSKSVGDTPQAQLEGAPPAPDAAAAPSAEPVVEQEPVVSPELAPPQPAAEPEPEGDVPFNKHPRWIERQAELERERAARADAERQNRLLLETIQRVAPQPQPPVQPDFWEGRLNHADPATAQYWQGQKQMFDLAAQAGEDRAIARLQPVLQAGMSQLSAISTKEFRKENPDIAPGSAEESLVIAYMNGQVDGVRHPIESARNNAVIKRLEAENRAFKSRQAGMPQKRAAARVEANAGIPSGAGLPERASNAQERAGTVIDRGGSPLDAAKAFFGW